MTTAQAAVAAVEYQERRRERRAASAGGRVGDSVALVALVLLAIALARAIGSGQARQWLRAKFLNVGPGEAPAAPAGFVPDSGAAGGTSAGDGGYLQDPIGSGFGTSPSAFSCFGASREGRTHEGLDINVPSGWPVAAPAAGTVTLAGMGTQACGLALTIDHGGNLVTHYCHLSAVTVSRGARVYRGQVVARTGGRPGAYGAGNSAAPHLHVSVYRNGVAVDPAPLFGRRCPS